MKSISLYTLFRHVISMAYPWSEIILQDLKRIMRRGPDLTTVSFFIASFVTVPEYAHKQET